MGNIMKKPLHVAEKKKFWFIGSASLILIGLLVIIIFGLNLGIDFTGGATLKVNTGAIFYMTLISGAGCLIAFGLMFLLSKKLKNLGKK